MNVIRTSVTTFDATDEAPLPAQLLPADAARSVLVGRGWDPEAGGPRVVTVRGDQLLDLTDEFSTVAGLLEHAAPGRAVARAAAPARWSLKDVAASSAGADPNVPRLLAPPPPAGSWGR
ncbi:hypothetical protein ACWELB_30650 [Streptomyces asiaticus]